MEKERRAGLKNNDGETIRWIREINSCEKHATALNYCAKDEVRWM